MDAEPRSLRSLGRQLRGQEGQAVFLLLMVAVSMLFFFSLMYHAGAVSLIKMRLQNTADVAAMAAATEQAQGLQTIARLNKKIMDTVVEANQDAFETHDPFPSDTDAEVYIKDEYLERIDQFVQQIEAVQKEAPARVQAAADSIARQNIELAQMYWHSPTLRDPRLGDVLVRLKGREDSEFHYVVKEPSASKAVHHFLTASGYFSGKTGEVVYAAVEVQIPKLRLGDSMFHSHIDSMSAYSVAKAWGSSIGGLSPRIPKLFTRWENTLPWLVWMSFPRWTAIPLLEHDPQDSDVWLVRVSDRRLDPPPVGIPDRTRFLH
jgi:putative Flp pilus-assembly TadE/G-like protein